MDNIKIRFAIERQFGIDVEDTLSSYEVINLESGIPYYLAYFEDAIHQHKYEVILNTDHSIEVFGTADRTIPDAKPRLVSIYESLPGAIVQMVWKPCAISPSPFYPFWKIDHATAIIYADSNGRIYDHLLTDIEPGLPVKGYSRHKNALNVAV